jgi:3-methylcrotonyl-CoA carboxylase alpha subunit
VQVLVDSAPHDFDVEWQSGGSIRLLNHPRGPETDSGGPLTADTHTNRERIFVQFGCVAVELAWPTYDASAVEDLGDGSVIRAPITGRVAKLFAKPGDAIDKGQRIAIVEAMKMEHVLTAARAGTIDKIPVAEGAQVTQGTLIAKLTVS